MIVATINVCNKKAQVDLQLPLTRGLVGAEVIVFCDASWDTLSKEISFKRNGLSTPFTQTEINKKIPIPPSLLSEPDTELMILVRGVDGAGEIMQPEVYANLGFIQEAAVPQGLPVYPEPGQDAAETIRVAEVIVDRNLITLNQILPITSGMVGAEVLFNCSEEWAELNIIAIFRAGEIERDVIVTDITRPVTIPPELLRESGHELLIGLWGCTDDGSLELPSTWAPAKLIRSGAVPEGVPPEKPDDNWGNQIEKYISSLLLIAESLDKKINEARRIAEENRELIAGLCGGQTEPPTDVLIKLNREWNERWAGIADPSQEGGN